MQGRKESRWVFCLLGLAVYLCGTSDRALSQAVSRPAQDNPPWADSASTGPFYTLTIVKGGNGQGKIAVNPPGSTFKKGTPVTLTALPAPYSVFEGWSGHCSGTARACTVILAGDRTVNAAFSLKTYTIQVHQPVNGVIHPFGAVKAVHGEKRKFQIIPLPGYRVSDVRVDKVSQGAVNSYTFKEVTRDHVLEAVFVKP
jgi:hypothetical protein